MAADRSNAPNRSAGCTPRQTKIGAAVYSPLLRAEPKPLRRGFSSPTSPTPVNFTDLKTHKKKCIKTK